ncbi:MAG: GTPase Era [Nitrospirales bacterium]|nr:GTPase Era [Nitrospirales bacterium]
MAEQFRSGYVSLTGRPNVGKSTLLNAILGEKVSIVSSRAQTTRNRIVGVKTLPDSQIVFLDTPGIHKPKHRLGEMMVREALESVKEVDIILFLVEPEPPGRGDTFIIETLKGLEIPVFLVINKADKVRKSRLLPVIEEYSTLYPFREIIPLSALTEDGVDVLMNTLIDYLPEGPKFYPDDIVTDQVERFMVSEIVREKIMEKTMEEVPHSVAVNVEQWTEKTTEGGKAVVSIVANILVERDGQKGIIIGKGGQMLKDIGSSAREEIEDLLGTKVFLELWVKVRKDWRSNESILRDLGFQ